MGRACSMYWEEAKCIHGLVTKHEQRRPLGQPGFMWQENINL